eukprot:TRINITY_DN74974_c0_g1_i1.p2 TRINITY_DN74974_c0_g1~~TRINITY_DN74974_c0_g1_i1.p2  ORF type:complete len:151 (+),score=58.13 TRINITY_DN74974_c0_g1_i1:49-453(+)
MMKLLMLLVVCATLTAADEHHRFGHLPEKLRKWDAQRRAAVNRARSVVWKKRGSEVSLLDSVGVPLPKDVPLPEEKALEEKAEEYFKRMQALRHPSVKTQREGGNPQALHDALRAAMREAEADAHQGLEGPRSK